MFKTVLNVMLIKTLTIKTFFQKSRCKTQKSNIILTKIDNVEFIKDADSKTYLIKKLLKKNLKK